MRRINRREFWVNFAWIIDVFSHESPSSKIPDEKSRVLTRGVALDDIFAKRHLNFSRNHHRAPRLQQRHIIFSVCFARNRYLIHGFYERARALRAVIGANFRAGRFMAVVRIALRDVEPPLHFDIFAGGTRRLPPIIVAILEIPDFSGFPDKSSNRGGASVETGCEISRMRTRTAVDRKFGFTREIVESCH